MILQPPFPNQEVRWELKTKPAFAPATPLQSGCPWQRPVGLCQCWATSVPGLLWVQKNVKEGGGFGNLPSAQDEWLSTKHTPPLSLLSPFSTHRGEAEKCNEPQFVYSLLLIVQRVITSPGESAVTNIIQSLHSIRYIRPSFLGLVCGFDHQLNKLYWDLETTQNQWKKSHGAEMQE